MNWVRRFLIALCLLMLGPLAMAASGKTQLAADWWTASRESAGLAPPPRTTPEAVVQVYAARAYAWRGIFAVHSWISVKPEGADGYTTYEVIGWRAFRGGSAVQIHNDDADRYWYGSKPEVLAELRGERAAQAIGDIEKAVTDYPYQTAYRTWPGPNSNTFVAFVARRVPALGLDLPPTAIGKDYLGETTFIGRTPSGGGLQLSLWGVLGVLVSAREGVEVNLLGLSFGVDPAELAIRLPGIGVVKP